MRTKPSEFAGTLYSVEGKIWVSTPEGAEEIYRKQNDIAARD